MLEILNRNSITAKLEIHIFISGADKKTTFQITGCYYITRNCALVYSKPLLLQDQDPCCISPRKVFDQLILTFVNNTKEIP